MEGLKERSRTDNTAAPRPLSTAGLLDGYSIEVMPRTAAKIESFRDLFPSGTRVYIANVNADINDMVATAKRITDDGFAAMPHFPARQIRDREMLETWVRRMREEAGVEQALLLGGNSKTPGGDFDSSMQMMQTGLFDKFGYTRLHVAGHPEGNADIDRDGSNRILDEALLWKQGYSEQTDAEMAIVTQFLFAAEPLIRWAERLEQLGVTIPIHVGLAGPAKLQTLMKYALTCGVGPSVKVLKKRAMDVSKLLLPYAPTDVLSQLAAYKSERPQSRILQVHFFPLGGIKACVDWADAQTGSK